MNAYEKYYIEKLDNLWTSIYPELWHSINSSKDAERLGQLKSRMPVVDEDDLKENYPKNYIALMEDLIYFAFPIMYFEMSGKWECMLSGVRKARDQYMWQPKDTE
jgi:hypothetical protein